ncbi:aldo/keto reductase [Albibacterium bauzanense]|uniref:Aryl-alcohol dehydrogenase-like predicted oxidoreductase n=1 Tax=Albibacterium bauzanense TaxID=653929 RepID=A0A4R1LTP8_9SPHI|nr:aldo/keto reductase [Albibacterium bauzanense]TCK80639.1 aryl-alcohol dehydrogenase-like predicted oxidoreductase [Albibacterium bauzanense]
MKKRTIGKSTLSVAPIAFGANVFGWTLNEKESFKILDEFVDNGFNLIDTADTYSTWVPGNVGGESETIIGNWIKQGNKRDRIILATKFGGDMGQGKKDLSAKYMKEAVEKSLKRLQTDYIDLYQSHYDDLETPVEETMEAFNQLVKDGKVRFIGASNLSAERIESSLKVSQANNWASYVSIQPLYNLYEREKFETEYALLVNKYELGVLNYYALASGFLSGKYRGEKDLNLSERGPGIKKYLGKRGFKILSALDTLALKYNATQARIAIAWLLHKPGITAPIASATNTEQLFELLKAASLDLSKEDVEYLDQESAWQ